MRRQQAIWQAEHTDMNTLPTMNDTDPASGVVYFAEVLKNQGFTPPRNGVDIGSGKGRNAIFLARIGFEMTGIDYISAAVATAQSRAAALGLSSINFRVGEIDRPWPIEDNYFDFAIDSFSSIDIETLPGRQICRDEMLRTLKPGGLALVTVCSANDEWEREYIAKHPGSEPNSTLWPGTGKFQKDYTESELQDFYQAFEVVELKTISKPATKMGRQGTATNIWMVIRKPK